MAETHDVVKRSLAAFALGTIGTDEAVSVRRHLARCKACRTELAGLRWTAVSVLERRPGSGEAAGDGSSEVAQRSAMTPPPVSDLSGRCHACGRPDDAALLQDLVGAMDELLTPSSLSAKAGKRPWNWRAREEDGTSIQGLPREQLGATLSALVEDVHLLSGQRAGPGWKVGDLVVEEDVRHVVRAGESVDLTGVEYQILCHLMRSSGKVVTKANLASAVWGPGGCNDNLMQRHIANLRRKLEAHGPRILHTVRGEGYVLKAR